MAIIRAYRDDNETKFYYKKNYVDDILRIDYSPFKSFRSWKGLFGMKREREAQRKAARIFKDMMNMVAAEMVHENNCFVFPKSRWGMLKVDDLTGRPNMREFSYKIEFDGITYGGVISLTNMVHKLCGKFYRFKFTRRWLNEIRMHQEKGFRY